MYLSTEFYVYAYLRNDGTPYYIGKGSKDRAWNVRCHRIHLPRNKSLIVILERNLTEVGALAIERRMINWYGRKDLKTGILRNLTDGGEGASGYRHTDEAKEKISKLLKGKSKPPMSEVQKELRRNKIWTDEERAKISAINKGRKHSAESKAKWSTIAKQRTYSKETRDKMRESRKARPPASDETKRKMKEAQLKRWQNKST